MNESNQPSDVELTSRIAKLETELGRQNENFDQVNKRFDDLSGQLASLCDVLGRTGSGQAITQEVDAQHTSSLDNPSFEDPNQKTLFQDMEINVAETPDALSLDDSNEESFAVASVPESTDEPVHNDVSNISQADVVESNLSVALEFTSEGWDGENSCGEGDEIHGAVEGTQIETPVESTADGLTPPNENTSEFEATQGVENAQPDAQSEFASAQAFEMAQAVGNPEDAAGFSDAASTEPFASVPATETAFETEAANERAGEPDGQQTAVGSSTTEEDQPLEALLSSLSAQFGENDEAEQQESPSVESLPSADASLQNENVTDTQTDESEATARGDELQDLFASLKSREEELVAHASVDDQESGEGAGTPEQTESSISELESSAAKDLVQQLSEAFDVPGESAQQTTDRVAEPTLEDLANAESAPETTVEENIETATGEETTTVAPSENKNESVAEVLARMQCMPELDNDNEPAEQASFEAPSPAPIQPVAEPASDSNDENAEDVQDYMNSLLQRLGGGPADPISEPVADAVGSEPEVEQEEVSHQEEFTPPEKPLKPGEFKPKQIAPEAESDLRAMRELANASTRSALSSSKQRQAKQMANTMLLLAVGGLPAAAVAWTMSTASGDALSWVAIGLFVMTVVCSGLFLKMAVAGKKAPSADSKEPWAAFEAKWNELKAFVMSKFRQNHEADN